MKDIAFEMGDWVAKTAKCEWGKADGIADELSINTAYLVIGTYDNGFLKLLNFIPPVDPQYLRMAHAREIVEAKKWKYEYKPYEPEPYDKEGIEPYNKEDIEPYDKE